MIKVAKFGGSSVASVDGFEMIAKWLQKENIQITVLSASGKTLNEPKVTDILIESYINIKKGESVVKSLTPFFERVRRDAERYKLYEKIKDELMIIGQEVEKTCLPDFILSRGEYVYAKLFSYFSGVRFVDSKNLIGFYDDGRLNLGYSEYKIRKEFSKGKFVTGGFYGSFENGNIKTFSRGGGDLSGSIMAKAINADEYINFTDVDGVYSLSPKICESKVIKEISFSGVRQLGEFGASVLHEDSVLPLVGTKTKIRLRNTFNENASGTLIYEDCTAKPFAVACKNGLNYFIAKKMGEGYELAKSFVEKGLKVLFLRSDKDRCEVCFSGEFDCEEFSRQNVVDFYSDTREVVLYYIAESDEGKSLVSNLLKEVDVKILSSVKGGFYVVVEDKNKEVINSKIKEFQGKNRK